MVTLILHFLLCEGEIGDIKCLVRQLLGLPPDGGRGEGGGARLPVRRPQVRGAPRPSPHSPPRPGVHHLHLDEARGQDHRQAPEGAHSLPRRRPQEEQAPHRPVRQELQAGAALQERLRRAGEERVQACGVEMVCDDTWHHYAVSLSEEGTQLYLDGELWQSQQNNPEIIDDWPLHPAADHHDGAGTAQTRR